ncbi:fructoselysine 6-kinase [Consotaella salsifontis]|uniref:Fructoselysine 6-kinase n=1 Tax=Consotaella salsifontis TaxID=1365950 RepID=A0A1T4P7C9_9HYPH|nr:fructoselysine 6-kinase [Consotaella salsifontis]SJZ86798.1 fructoselysine 6-kinase [Consotaella salsifontis]
MTSIVAVGDNCIDYYAALDAARPGGNAVNVAVNVVRCGGQAAYVGVVGDDHHGRLLLDALRNEGVDISHVRIAPGKTAVTQVSLDNGERVLGEYDDGVQADFRLTDSDLAFVAQHDLLTAGLWGHVEHDLAAVRALNVPIAFDCATEPGHAIVDVALPSVDVAFFSADRAPDDALRDQLRSLAARGPRLVVATLGEYGSAAWTEGRMITCPAEPTRVVDTMGAGDSYIGAFCWAMVTGASIADCMKAGTRSATRTLLLDGAW